MPATALLRWLGRAPAVGDTRPVGWRIDVSADDAIGVGVRESALGGPYEGPAHAAHRGGSLDLHWADGRLTRASLDRRTLTDPAAAASEWLAAAAREPSLPPLAGAADVPAVEVFSPEIAAAVRDDASPLLALAHRVRDDILGGGGTRADLTLRARTSHRIVATSAGFFAAWDETSCVLDMWVDETAGASYHRRRLPEDADVERLVGLALNTAGGLRDPDVLPDTARGVLLMPGAVEALIDHFVLPNLHGRVIRDGRSPVTLADLAGAARLIREDLSLTIDTTRPFDAAAAPCSPEGVPAGCAALISSGRFVSPILDLATARALSRPPTPAPRGRPRALLAGTGLLPDLSSALAVLGDGAIVRGLPGLHTQDRRGWRYALVAPDAQAVRSGRPGGRCAVAISGQLLDQLRQPTTRLVRITGEANPALLVTAGVRIVPA